MPRPRLSPQKRDSLFVVSDQRYTFNTGNISHPRDKNPCGNLIQVVHADCDMAYSTMTIMRGNNAGRVSCQLQETHKFRQMIIRDIGVDRQHWINPVFRSSIAQGMHNSNFNFGK